MLLPGSKSTGGRSSLRFSMVETECSPLEACGPVKLGLRWASTKFCPSPQAPQRRCHIVSWCTACRFHVSERIQDSPSQVLDLCRESKDLKANSFLPLSFSMIDLDEGPKSVVATTRSVCWVDISSAFTEQVIEVQQGFDVHPVTFITWKSAGLLSVLVLGFQCSNCMSEFTTTSVADRILIWACHAL